MPDTKQENAIEKTPSKYATIKPVVIVGTMAWADVPARFLSEWMQLFATWQVCDWDAEFYMQINWASLLPHVRNAAVIQAIEKRPHFTHLILVDSDMKGLYIDQVRKLVEYDVPIVGPLCTRKIDPYSPAIEDEDGCEAIYQELRKDEPGLVPRKWIGTGCICIRRDVIDAMAIKILGSRLGNGERLQHGYLWFRTGRSLAVDWERRRDETIVRGAERVAQIVVEKSEANEPIRPGDFIQSHGEAFEVGFEVFNEAATCGEDLEFGLRALLKGYESYVDCGITLGHLGLRAVDIEDHAKAANVEIKKRQSAEGLKEVGV